jgi:type I restriction enzyme S subunit
MSKIDELIQELCPDGVKWKQLGDICVSLRKGTLKRGQLVDDGAYPVINSGREWYGFYDSYNNEADALIIAARGNAGFVSYISTKFWAGGLCYPYRSIKDDVIQTKFIYYYLKNNEQSIMDTLVARGSIPAINKSDVDKIQIPIPPLPIQQEIVRILDNFTKLEAELEAELEARKKQYEYYRNQLLTTIEKDGKWYMSGNEVGWKTLGEVCVSLRKGTLKRGQLVEDGAYPVINSGREWYGFYESYNNEADALIIAARGEYAGFVSYISTKFWAGGLCYPYRSIKDDVIQTKFIYYYLKNNEQSIMDVLVSRGSIPAINKSDVDRIQIPIPPLSEQERIVSILDRFDALVNDISIGLPAEIEARRKQYEYYRGKLLSFKNIADRAEA